MEHIVKQSLQKVVNMLTYLWSKFVTESKGDNVSEFWCFKNNEAMQFQL